MATISADIFRQGMRRLGAAVNIVAAGKGDQLAGLTASAVTSLSAEPPRLLACINQDGGTYKSLKATGLMSVNVLTKADQALAARFGGIDGTPEEQRFEKGDWAETTTGTVRLTSALVSFVCTVNQIIDTETHGIVIGDIKEIFLSDSTAPITEAIAYIDGQWAGFQAI